MAYVDMSAAFVYKDLVTYQDLNQLGENDKTHTHDGSVTAEINVATTKGISWDSTANKKISDTSGGTGSTALYIGNAAITVASDKRIKENIRDTKLNALDIISKLEVKDFTWNDPTDTVKNNRNSRGEWTGLIAQDTIDILPFIVNAEDKNCNECKNGQPCEKHKSPWSIEYNNAVPVLIKAIQELTLKVKTLQRLLGE